LRTTRLGRRGSPGIGKAISMNRSNWRMGVPGEGQEGWEAWGGEQMRKKSAPERYINPGRQRKETWKKRLWKKGKGGGGDLPGKRFLHDKGSLAQQSGESRKAQREERPISWGEEGKGDASQSIM